MEDSVSPPFHLRNVYIGEKRERGFDFPVCIKAGCFRPVCYRPADRAGWRLSASARASHLLPSMQARGCKSITVLIQTIP